MSDDERKALVNVLAQAVREAEVNLRNRCPTLAEGVKNGESATAYADRCIAEIDVARAAYLRLVRLQQDVQSGRITRLSNVVVPAEGISAGQ